MFFRKQLGERFLIHFFGSGHEVRPHDFTHSPVFVSRHQPAQWNDSEKVLLGIEHVGIVDRFNLLGLPAQIRDRLVHGHVGTKTGETGTHQTAGIIFRVGK